MGLTKLPLRYRTLPVLAIAFGAPVCAEFLQAYLPSTGDAPQVLLSLLILAPLYGGAALLIREVAVRRGLGWTGVLLLAAAFGIAMQDWWTCRCLSSTVTTSPTGTNCAGAR